MFENYGRGRFCQHRQTSPRGFCLREYYGIPKRRFCFREYDALVREAEQDLDEESGTEDASSEISYETHQKNRALERQERQKRLDNIENLLFQIQNRLDNLEKKS